MPSLDQLRRLLEADPNDPFVLYALAQEHAKAGDRAAAVDFFDRCLAADPAYVYAWYHKAKALLADDRRDDALAAARAGLAKAREIGEAHAVGELRALIDEIEEG